MLGPSEVTSNHIDDIRKGIKGAQEMESKMEKNKKMNMRQALPLQS